MSVWDFTIYKSSRQAFLFSESLRKGVKMTEPNKFESWGDIPNWLEDMITEGTDISERVDRAMYPFKYDYTLW